MEKQKMIKDSAKKIDLNKAITVVYKNYRGEVAQRKIIPVDVFFASNEYHKDEQWLLKVFDIEKNDYRTYALKDIQSWLHFP